MALCCTWIPLSEWIAEPLSTRVVMLEQVRTAVTGRTVSVLVRLITQFCVRRRY